MAELQTYRHRVTGLLGEYGPGMAAVFGDVLEAVEPDAKPLAYTPIPQEAVADIIAARDSTDSVDAVDPTQEDSAQ